MAIGHVTFALAHASTFSCYLDAPRRLSAYSYTYVGHSVYSIIVPVMPLQVQSSHGLVQARVEPTSRERFIPPKCTYIIQPQLRERDRDYARIRHSYRCDRLHPYFRSLRTSIHAIEVITIIINLSSSLSISHHHH